MTAGQSPRRDLRALLIGAAIILPALGFQLGVRPYLSVTAELRERALLERALLARERSLLEGAVRLPVQMGELDARSEALRPLLLSGGSPVEREGTLVTYLATRAERSGLLLQRSEGREPTTVEESLLAATSVVVQALGDLEGVLRFLHELEAGPLLVNVERLQLQPSPLRTADPAEAQPLAFGALLTAYSLAATAEAGEALALTAGGSGP